MPREPHIVRDDQVIRIAAWNSVLFHVWLGTSTPDVMRDVCHHEIEFAKQQPGRKYALVSVVRVPTIADFGADARKALERRLQSIEPFMLASVTILPSNGLASSIVRGIITGLSLLSPSKVPATVVSSPDDACTWLEPRLPLPNRMKQGELKQALQTVISPPARR